MVFMGNNMKIYNSHSCNRLVKYSALTMKVLHHHQAHEWWDLAPRTTKKAISNNSPYSFDKINEISQLV